MERKKDHWKPEKKIHGRGGLEPGCKRSAFQGKRGPGRSCVLPRRPGIKKAETAVVAPSPWTCVSVAFLLSFLPLSFLVPFSAFPARSLVQPGLRCLLAGPPVFPCFYCLPLEPSVLLSPPQPTVGCMLRGASAWLPHQLSVALLGGQKAALSSAVATAACAVDTSMRLEPPRD